jgi:DNA-binding NarL/FixJ family response regulator
MVRGGEFEIVLLALDLPGRGGIKTTELILQRSPSTRILGIMEKADRDIAEKLIAAGAMGCILTTIEPDTLVSAIRTILGGRHFYSNDIALCLLEPGLRFKLDAGERLTLREKEVLRGILGGLRNQEVADRLGISKRTVDKHREHVKAKLGARNMIDLVQAGVRLGLVSGLPGGIQFGSK